MDEELKNQYDQIESLLRIHRCETAALLHEVVELSSRVRILMKAAETNPKVPIGMVEVPDSFVRFMENRKKYLQQDLEKLEKLDPGRAARLQEIIDERGEEFQYDQM